jgi:hypothetical protein
MCGARGFAKRVKRWQKGMRQLECVPEVDVHVIGGCRSACRMVVHGQECTGAPPQSHIFFRAPHPSGHSGNNKREVPAGRRDSARSRSAMQPSTAWCGPMVSTVGSWLANALSTHRRPASRMPTQVGCSMLSGECNASRFGLEHIVVWVKQGARPRLRRLEERLPGD